MAERIPFSSTPTDFDGFRQRLSKIFKKQSGYPKFKKKGQHDSFRFPDAKQIKLEEDNQRVFLPKLGWIRYRLSFFEPLSFTN
ncbi:MAG: hypothetical protein GX641_04035 [Mollicutes bacterium]|nr:hypothetical protein [Mollicutes bacterium]